MDDHWINLGYLVPLVAVPLTFALYYVPGVERNWLLLRVLIACLFGAHYVLDKGLNAHSEQGPGVGTVYIMSLGLVLVIMVVGSILSKSGFKTPERWVFPTLPNPSYLPENHAAPDHLAGLALALCRR